MNMELPPGITPDMIAASMKFLMEQHAATQKPKLTGLIPQDKIRGVNPGYAYQFREYPKAINPPPETMHDHIEERQFRSKYAMPLPYKGDSAAEYTADYYALQEYPKRMFPPQVIVYSETEEDKKLASWRATSSAPRVARAIYPKWMFSADREPVLVDDREAEVALGDGWFPTPAGAINAAAGEGREALVLTPRPEAAADAPPVPEPPKVDPREALFEQAADLGVEVDRRWGIPKLQAEIAAAREAQTEAA